MMWGWNRGLQTLLLVVALDWLTFVSHAADYRAGETYFGRNQYIEYLAGDLPLILTAPHGGRDKPEELPDRQTGTFAFDVGTQELARVIAKRFHAKTGGHPHVVICRVHRRKLDCNREIVEAAAKNPDAEATWREYHGFLDSALETVAQQHGRGFFIDLHGHGHEDPRLEIGYLLDAKGLGVTDESLNQPTTVEKTSVRMIVSRGQTTLADLLRGPNSFGALMEQRGFRTSPSPRDPQPMPPFFSGGFTTMRMTRESKHPVAGFQIETNYKGVRDNDTSRTRFADALYDSLVEYLERHLELKLKPATKASANGS